jgi:transcriptional regulator with XRE-family HTH domain
MQASPQEFVPSGIADLDDVLGGGLLAGDNVVWLSESRTLLTQIEDLLLQATHRLSPIAYVTTDTAPAAIRSRIGEEAEILDARARSRLTDAVLLEQAILAAAMAGAGRIIIDNLDSLARRWDTKKAVGFFKRVCPRLFNLGAVAYWRASRSAMGGAAIGEILKVTQCVFEVSERNLRVLKAEGHSALVQGRLFRITRDEQQLSLHAERALGRLAAGLKKLRLERNLSQADLARLADVSASAISQAEGGQRGLSLDTLLTITTALGVGIDELLENRQRPDYILARRNRGTELGASRFLLDDPSAGLRVYLVNLPPNSQGAPPVPHKGSEVLLVARGLVLVDLGESSPAVRAGDAILARKAPIVEWRNLSPENSVLFWILRD